MVILHMYHVITDIVVAMFVIPTLVYFVVFHDPLIRKQQKRTKEIEGETKIN